MDYQTIAIEREGRAAILRLDRPDKRNALSMDLIDELSDALEELEADQNVRAVVLTGAGTAFSSGYDLSESIGSSEGPPTAEEWMKQLGTQPQHVYTIYELDIPVIAAVNGPALAGGSDLALVCDLTLASDEAEFGYPAIRMGGLTATLTYPFVMGSIKHARELLYSGKTVGADEAQRFGMVNRTVPHDQLMEEALKEVQQIEKVPSEVVTLSKHMLNGVMEQQGFRPSVKQSEFIATVAHLTSAGKEFHRLVEEEGLDAAFKWMYEADK